MFGGGYCGELGVGGWLLMIGAWVALLAVVVWAVTRLFPGGGRRAEAGQMLDRRFAAGEIDAEAYRQARDELTGAGRR